MKLQTVIASELRLHIWIILFVCMVFHSLVGKTFSGFFSGVDCSPDDTPWDGGKSIITLKVCSC